MLRKPLAFAIGVLMASGLLVSATTTTGVAASSLTVKRAPSNPWPGEVTTLNGKIGPRGRTVVLQKQVAGRWIKVRTGRTKKAGAFSLAVRAGSTRVVYRVVAPKARVGGKTYRKVTTRTRTVVAKSPRVRLAFGRNPVVDKKGRALTAGRVSASPASDGATATVQRLTSSGWRGVTSGKLVKGTYSFRIQTGTYRYRAIVKARGGSTWTISPAVKPGWRVVWRDEFSNAAQSRKSWNHRDLGKRGARRICSTTGAGQTTYPGSVMRLRVSKDSSPKQDPTGPQVRSWKESCPDGTYLNAMVDGQLTKQFTHGVFAARIKFQAPQGMHSAFWLQSAGTPEIDVAEYFGDGRSDGGLASFLHSRPTSKGDFTSVGGVLKTAKKILTNGRHTPASGYHVYSVEWTSAGYVFRVDGKVTMRTSRLRSNDPHFLVLSLVSSDWEMKQLDKRKLSKAYMDVDWVRVWQK